MINNNTKNGFRVKSISWQKLENSETHRGYSSVGYYYIHPMTGFWFDLVGPYGKIGTYKRIEDAMAAEQDDIEKRVLDSLVPDLSVSGWDLEAARLGRAAFQRIIDLDLADETNDDVEQLIEKINQLVHVDDKISAARKVVFTLDAGKAFAVLDTVADICHQENYHLMIDEIENVRLLIDNLVRVIDNENL